MRSQPDLASQRHTPSASPDMHVSIMFGALASCFVFAVVFVSLGWGMP